MKKAQHVTGGSPVSPLKAITDKERGFESRITTKDRQSGNLIVALRNSQAFMLGLLTARELDVPLASQSQLAIRSLAVHSFNLSRAADRAMSYGYPLQALSLVRSLYEAVATAAYFWSSPEQVDKWIVGKAGSLPTYASSANQDFISILEEYARLRGHNVDSAITQFRSLIPRTYGLLSRYAHPEYDVVRAQVLVDKEMRLRWYSLGPSESSSHMIAVPGQIILTLQAVLGALLLIEFRDSLKMSWEQLAALWETNVVGQVLTMHSVEKLGLHSCAISFSNKDENFADRLYSSLKALDVRCWYSSEDLKVGDKMRDRIEESIWQHDKLLLILSEPAIQSPWVEAEVEAALEKERVLGETVVFPVMVDDSALHTAKAWTALIRRTRHIGDFRQWNDHDAYQAAFERLLRDLKAEGG